MKGTPAIYLGKIVDKEHFRTYVYGAKGEKKLVESWNAYEAAMQSGLWFSTKEDAQESVSIDEEFEINPSNGKPKRKPRSKAKPKPVLVEEIEEEFIDDLDDGMVFEVKPGQ